MTRGPDHAVPSARFRRPPDQPAALRL